MGRSPHEVPAGGCPPHQLLPDGGDLANLGWDTMRAQFRTAVAYGAATGSMPLTDTAKATWRAHYPRLSAEQPGLFGSATARAG